ncbi:hypothetical protein ACSSMI_18605, partial [Escherichia coli]|uniref:hypothetical protein n=1 Tax=Escherichia coli TaxID=562 RepID=UPI003FCF8339
MHIDTAPYPAPPATITSTSDSSNQHPNAFLYELIRNKHASHIEIFAKIVGNDSNLLIVFYVQIMPDDFVM